MSGELFSGPGELARLRQVLGLPAGTPEPVVEAELTLRLDLAGDLVAEVDQVMNAEAEYLATALEVGWAWWAIDG